MIIICQDEQGAESRRAFKYIRAVAQSTLFDIFGLCRVWTSHVAFSYFLTSSYERRLIIDTNRLVLASTTLQQLGCTYAQCLIYESVTVILLIILSISQEYYIYIYNPYTRSTVRLVCIILSYYVMLGCGGQIIQILLDQLERMRRYCTWCTPFLLQQLVCIDYTTLEYSGSYHHVLLASSTSQLYQLGSRSTNSMNS